MNSFFNTIRKMNLGRGPQRWVGGVCGGIAHKYNVDVAYVRIGFLILSILPAFPGIAVYLVAWLLLPNRNGAIALESLLNERP